MNKFMHFILMVTMAVTMSACLPDGDLGSETSKTQIRREAQATGLARSLAVVSSRVFGSFTTDSNSPFVIAAQSGGVDNLATTMVDFKSTFGLSLGPAGDKVKAGYCGDTNAGTGKSFIVWLSDADSNNKFLPKGLGDGASGAVMAELSNMSDPSSVGYVSNNRLEMQDGQSLTLGSCQNAFNIPVGAPVMVFANIEEVAIMKEVTTRTETRTIACTGDQTGTVTEKRDIVVSADNSENTGGWTVVTDLCSGTVSQIAASSVSASNADLLGSGSAVVGALPNGVLKNLLGDLAATDCVSGTATKTVVDPNTGETETITYDTCEDDNVASDAVAGLVSVPVGDPYEETISRACSSSTLGESDPNYETTTIPGTGGNTLTGKWSTGIWSPNNGAVYKREIQDYNVTYPDGTVTLVSARGKWEGKSLNCMRSETITFDADDFAPIWTNLGVDVNNLTLIENDGISYTRTATVNGWANAQTLTPNAATYSPWSEASLSGKWQERTYDDITCPTGGAGVRTNLRTHTLTGYRTVTSSAWTSGDNCGGTCLTDNSGRKGFNNTVRALWASFNGASDSSQFSGTDGKLRNNCPTGYAPTELRDDSDSSHSIAEDNFKGSATQLCLKTSVDSISMTSEWKAYGCSSGMTHTGVYDSPGGSTDKDSRYYTHKHYLDEEKSTTNHWNWCLGVNDPSGNSTVSITRPNVSACPSDSTLLITAHNEEWNVNNEDGRSNRAVCLQVQSVVEDRVQCPITGPWTVGEFGACSATCGGGTQTRTVTCEYDECTGTQPVTTQSCNTQACVPGLTYAWETGAYGACTNGTQTRDVICRGSDGNVYPDSNCTGTRPTATQSCTAPVDGVCGSANGTSYSDASALNSAQKCSSGSPSIATHTGNGPWSWTCSGTSGGSVSGACSATQTASTPTCTWTQTNYSANTKICSGGENNENIQTPTCTFVGDGQPVSEGAPGYVTPGTSCQSHAYEAEGACVAGGGVTFGPVTTFTCSPSTDNFCGASITHQPNAQTEPDDFSCPADSKLWVNTLGNYVAGGNYTTTNFGCTVEAECQQSCIPNTEGAYTSVDYDFDGYVADGTPMCDRINLAKELCRNAGNEVDNCEITNFVRNNHQAQCVASADVRPICTYSAASYSWFTGSYSTCSAACDGGTRTRTVSCKSNSGTTVADSNCSGTKPSTTSACSVQACTGNEFTWQFVGSYSACTTGTQSRAASCVDGSTSNVVADSNCTSTKPNMQTQACGPTVNGSCSQSIPDCSAGTSANYSQSGNTHTWQCVGYGVPTGSTANCSKTGTIN